MLKYTPALLWPVSPQVELSQQLVIKVPAEIDDKETNAMRPFHRFLIRFLSVLGVFLPLTAAAQTAFWQQTNGPSGGPVGSLAINRAGHVFASGGGIFSSMDHGETWSLTSLTTGGTLVINNAGHIFVGAFGGVFRSMDNGESWTQVNTGLTDLVLPGAELS